MKKVLSFLVAGALALGLIGCSGDMHNDVDPATIPASIALASAPRLSAGGVAGAMQGWSVDTITWTTKDDDNCKYTYDFVANAEEIEWKVVSVKGNWNSGAYGGGADTVTDANVGKTVTLTYDNATGGNKNVKTSGLKKDKVYTITLEYNKGNYDCTVTASDKEKPVPFYLDAFFFKGSYGDGTWSDSVSNLLRNPTVNEQTGEVEYKLEVACTDVEAGKNVEFGLANEDWKTKYTGADLKVGEDYKELTSGAENNNTVDMKKGASYIVYVKTTPEKKVFCKITELPVYVTLKVKITGLDKKLAGKTAIIGGSWNWDLGWTSAWGKTKKVSELMSGKVDANGTVVCKYPEQLKYNKNQAVDPFQFCGYIGEEKDDDVAKADYEIKFNNDNFVVINSITTEEDAVWVIEVDMDAEEAKAKKEPPLANVIVTDLPEELNGAELYFTGNFNDWKKPGEEGTFKVVVTDGKIELKDIDITLKPSGDFAFEGKFSAAGWTRPEVTSDDTSGNVKVTMSASKPTLKGTYKSAKDHKDGGKVYICDWSVE